MLKQGKQNQLKIKSMETEIDRMKVQRVSLMRRMKEESEKHRKWKLDQARTILQVKNSNLKKDREIQQLRRDNKRKDIVARRKQEELVALKER